MCISSYLGIVVLLTFSSSLWWGISSNVYTLLVAVVCIYVSDSINNEQRQSSIVKSGIYRIELQCQHDFVYDFINFNEY